MVAMATAFPPPHTHAHTHTHAHAGADIIQGPLKEQLLTYNKNTYLVKTWLIMLYSVPLKCMKKTWPNKEWAETVMKKTHGKLTGNFICLDEAHVASVSRPQNCSLIFKACCIKHKEQVKATCTLLTPLMLLCL